MRTIKTILLWVGIAFVAVVFLRFLVSPVLLKAKKALEPPRMTMGMKGRGPTVPPAGPGMGMAGPGGVPAGAPGLEAAPPAAEIRKGAGMPLLPGATSEAVRSSQAAPPAGPVSGVAYAAVGRKLVRTAQLDLEVENADKFLRKVEVLAREMGGFVSNTSLAWYGQVTRTGSISVRVPSERFEDALVQIRLLGKVESLSAGVQDITGAFTDLEARIRNSLREEQEILKLFQRSGKLSDIITVEEKLAEVRERIERDQSQLRSMREQVDLSTITIQFHEKYEHAPQPEPERYDAMYHVRSAYRGLISILQGILTFLIYFIITGWVLWLPVALIVVVVRRARLRRAQRRAQQERQALEEALSVQPGQPPAQPPEEPGGEEGS